MNKAIAFFDFDGTITTHDTMLELVKFYKGSLAYYKGMLLLLPYLIAMKLGIIKNTLVKERFLKKFFRNLPIEEFKAICKLFAKEILPTLIRPQALATIKKLQHEGVQVVVVIASAENWIKPWCDEYNIICLASCLEIANGELTGNLNGANCHNEEKVRRIKESYKLEEYTTIYCYGDTKGDKPMLRLATHSFYKPFR